MFAHLRMRLASVRRQNDQLSAHNYELFLIICTYLIILSFDSQLTAYFRQKHINYSLHIISNYVHIIVIVCLSCCFKQLACVKSTLQLCSHIILMLKRSKCARAGLSTLPFLFVTMAAVADGSSSF